MRAIFIALAVSSAAVPALAQPISEKPPTRTIQCIEVNGRAIPPICRVPASRLDGREDICTCPVGGQRIDVAVCGKGQVEPPEGKALLRARRAAMRDGSLIGDTVEGRPICVAPRRP